MREGESELAKGGNGVKDAEKSEKGKGKKEGGRSERSREWRNE